MRTEEELEERKHHPVLLGVVLGVAILLAAGLGAGIVAVVMSQNETTIHVHIEDFAGDGPGQLQVRDENDQVIATTSLGLGDCWPNGCDTAVDVVVPEAQFYEVLLEGGHLEGFWTTTVSFSDLESNDRNVTLDSGAGYPGLPRLED